MCWGRAPEYAHLDEQPGGDLRQQGDAVGARKLQEETLAIRRRVLGPEHPETAHSMNNLEHFQSRYIVNSAVTEPGASVVRGDTRESLRNRLFQRLGGSGLERT